ncbi:MAG: ATPase domain-containing protein [Aquisalimonadaceae bacterium]
MREFPNRVHTGVEGLDEILSGGLIGQRAYLVRGGPGQGKTTLGLSFLSASAADETALFIGFQEPEAQLRQNAASIQLDISGIRFLSLAPDEQFFTQQHNYDVFSAADVEQEPLANTIVQTVEQHSPARVFIDSLTQLRYLSADIFQYRQQVLSFLRFLTQRGATVLFSSENSTELPDDDLQFIADGVINLEASTSGAALRVSKLRGSDFRRGAHHVRVGREGVTVFPRMMPPPSRLTDGERRLWHTGLANIDDMLHGGLEAGTVSMITGPSGIGKSTMATLFAAQAARDGYRAMVYLFEEEVSTFLQRARSLRIGVAESLKAGRLSIEQIEPMRYLADEFTMRVRKAVEEESIDLVVLDSVSGFELALDGEDVKPRLHSLAKTLTRLGVTVLIINETEAMTGQFRISEKGISYLSDNVIFLRYVELNGGLTKAMGVLKKRMGSFDNALRAFEIGRKGLMVGDAMEGLNGVILGTPMPQDGGA